MQTVHLSITQSGMLGLFTGGFMASGIPDHVSPTDIESLLNYCARMEFKLDERRTLDFIHRHWANN